MTAKLRTHSGGKLRIEPTGLLPVDPNTGVHFAGFSDHWWVGLAMLPTLVTLEHNYICDLRAHDHPDWTDDQLFARAKLINSAVMAKIHTVEWTPAILPHPIVKQAMNVNWSGLVGEDHQELAELLDDRDLLGGIIGSKADHHGAPYSLTEQFVAVYRMHPLMPDLFYSFGTCHPGAVTLHNYPRHLQNLTRDDGEHLDLAAVDLLRDRERGVPRYNQFRRLLNKDAVKSFDELTDNPEWRRQLTTVYNNDLESVDLMTGLYAEPLPEDVGFSDTAFRVFILMALRRLKSDRFFTDAFRPEVDTEFGIESIRKNTIDPATA